MAEALQHKPGFDLASLTDCMFFINGRCKLDENCRFRHCPKAAEQINNCPRWPKKCRNMTCPYRHPTISLKTEKKKPPVTQALVNHPCQPQAPAIRQEGFISFFWDIENVPIPKGQKPFDIVQRIRQKLVVESGLQEAEFSCYCNIATISQENQQSLHLANVRIIHVPDRKPNAVDRQIMLDLDRFERVHRPPATVVLISGDIDFVGKLSDLRHQARFHVIVIHNKPAKEELKATVNEHYAWESFTQQQLLNLPNVFHPIESKATPQSRQQIRSRDPSRNNRVLRRDPSRSRGRPLNMQQESSDDRIVKTYECPICKKEFESIQGLRQHQNVKNHLFSCAKCKENFVTSEGLAQHQRDKKHYILDFKCNQCNRSFAKLDSLNQHQQSTGHTTSVIPASLISSSTHGGKLEDVDPIDIILNGIEAMAKYYPIRLPTNN